MKTIQSHKDLDVWNRSVDLARRVYLITQKLPAEEKFGLSVQIRKSGVSIPSNIAEGAARKSKLEFIQFLYIALGSLSELETQVFISAQVFDIDECYKLQSEIDDIRQMLLGLIRFLHAQ